MKKINFLFFFFASIFGFCQKPPLDINNNGYNRNANYTKTMNYVATSDITSTVIDVWDMSNYQSITITFSTGSNLPNFTLFTSEDLLDWTPVQMDSYTAGFANNSPVTVTLPNVVSVFKANRQKKFFRLTRVSNITVSILINVELSQASIPERGLVIPTDAVRRYVSSTAITTTTAVAMFASSNLAAYIHLSSLNIYNSGGTGTNFVIQDNAGTPNIVFRGFVKAGDTFTIVLNEAATVRTNAFNGSLYIKFLDSGFSCNVTATGFISHYN